MDITLAGSSLTRNWSDEELRGLSIELSAFDGQISTSTIPIPDPAGGDEVPPGRAVRVVEGATRLLDGIIVQEGRSRGFEPTNPNKKDDYTVEDPNTFLYGFRVIADRLEETDYDRILWFFTTYLPSADTTFVVNSDTVTMVAKSYQSDGVADIMRDAIDITGKTLFVHDLASGGLCAHWHALTAGHTCGLTIDDSDPSVNGPTDWLPQNPSRVRDGHDLTNDYAAYGADGIGPVSVSDGTSIATYDVDGKSHQAFANFPEALDVTTLTADANRLLATNKDPRDTWTCTIGPLDETALANIRVGDIITCTSTVMTLSAEPQRIASLRLTVAGGQRVAPTLWMAELTLGAPVRGPSGRSTARPPVLVPPAYLCDPAFGDGLSFTWIAPSAASTFDGTYYTDATGGVGPTLTLDLDYSNPIGQVLLLSSEIDSWHVSGNLYFTGGQVGDGYPRSFHDWFVIGGLGSPSDLGLAGINLNAPGYASGPLREEIHFSDLLAQSGFLFFKIRRIQTSVGVWATEFKVWPTDASSAEPPWSAVGDYGPLLELMFTYEKSGGGYFGDPPVHLGVGNIVVSSCAGSSPRLGQIIYLEASGTSDGATTGYTTAFPYAPGALEVIVDSLPWADSGYVETDPSTGAWDFVQVPETGDTIQVTYRAA